MPIEKTGQKYTLRLTDKYILLTEIFPIIKKIRQEDPLGGKRMSNTNKENHIFPFLWMRGEDEDVMRTEMQKIAECGIGAVCVEARPHDDYCGPGWWHDMDIIMDEAEKRDMKIFMLQNESASEDFEGEIILPTNKKLCIMLGLDGQKSYLPGKIDDEKTMTYLHLYAGESCVIMEAESGADYPLFQSMNELIPLCGNVTDISKEWSVCKTRMIDYPSFGEKEEMENLIPISDVAPTFSGVIQYEKTIELEKKPEKAVLQLEHVYEVMTVYVNGENAGMCIRPPYQLEISDYLTVGKNEITIEVATTPDRDQMNYPAPPFVMSHAVKEPTGMFGNIKIFTK